MNIDKDDIGRKVFSVLHGWCVIIEWEYDKEYRFVIETVDKLKFSVNHKGYYWNRQYHKHPTVRWQQVDITDPPKPEPERTATITESEFGLLHSLIILYTPSDWDDKTIEKLRLKLFGTPTGEE